MGAMITQSPLRRPPLLVAEGGASALEPAHSAAAVGLGVRLGATAVAVRAWRTADDVLVLSATGSARRGLRRVELASLTAADVEHLATLDLAAEALGPDAALVVEAPDVETGDAVVAWVEGRDAGSAPVGAGLWLWGDDIEALARWGEVPGVAGTVHGVRVEEVNGSLERHFSRLRDLGVTALGLPRASWTGGLVAMAHRFRREAWANGAEHTRMAVELLAMGMDAVGGPHPDRLVDAAVAVGAERSL